MVTYKCPMHSEVQEEQAGRCPKCGMALESETVAMEPEVEYTCPMHPEVLQKGPGTCPTCGMALEPRTTTRED